MVYINRPRSTMFINRPLIDFDTFIIVFFSFVFTLLIIKSAFFDRKNLALLCTLYNKKNKKNNYKSIKINPKSISKNCRSWSICVCHLLLVLYLLYTGSWVFYTQSLSFYLFFYRLSKKYPPKRNTARIQYDRNKNKKVGKKKFRFP